jgi:hypothetical protein
MLPRAPAAAAAAGGAGAGAAAARRRLLQLAGHYSPSSSYASSLSTGVPAASSPAEEVIAAVSPEGGVGTITLNRPRALNALNLNMVRALDGVLKEWAADTKVGRLCMYAFWGVNAGGIVVR